MFRKIVGSERNEVSIVIYYIKGNCAVQASLNS
jgi:hypothetical protein